MNFSNDLDVEAPDAVLVIDDIHLIDENPLLVESLRRFVQHVPGWLHVVLAARRTPDLPIERMRARGTLSEVNSAELRFSSLEAIELLTQLSPTLTAVEVTAAVDRVDGWAAGLQMAAFAARSAQERRSMRRATTSTC